MAMTTNLFLTTTLRGWFDGAFGGRNGDWHMMNLGRGGLFPGGLYVLGLALLLLLIWAVRTWSSRTTPAAVGAGNRVSSYTADLPVTRPAPAAATPPVDTPLHALQMRYAKGDISRAEYETIRADLLADSPISPATVAETTPSQPDPVETPVVNDATDEVPSETVHEESTIESEKRTDV